MNRTPLFLLANLLVAAVALLAEEPSLDGRFEFPEGKSGVFGWQRSLVEEPKGGEAFASSAFIHPLCTPGGFVCTDLQPSDHLHHFGVWWPWKHIEVEGEKFNTWEIQEGEGAHVARDLKVISRTAEKAEFEFLNETIVKPKGAKPKVVISERALVTVQASREATVVDITLDQQAAGAPVRILAHRYSGFSWRGPHDWNKDNSTMITSGSRGRDQANGTSAKWIAVSGPTATGTASVLILSAAEKIAGSPEHLRVWDSKNHNGAPFVNFNPVMKKPLALDKSNPAVAHRKYRVIASDKFMDAATAEAEWRKWMGE